MARWNVPATIVVNNNNSFNQEISLWTQAYEGELHGRHGEMWQFRTIDFSAIAREMGVQATRVEDPADLSRALKEAIETGGPGWRSQPTCGWMRPRPTCPRKGCGRP